MARPKTDPAPRRTGVRVVLGVVAFLVFWLVAGLVIYPPNRLHTPPPEAPDDPKAVDYVRRARCPEALDAAASPEDNRLVEWSLLDSCWQTDLPAARRGEAPPLLEAERQRRVAAFEAAAAAAGLSAELRDFGLSWVDPVRKDPNAASRIGRLAVSYRSRVLTRNQKFPWTPAASRSMADGIVGALDRKAKARLRSAVVAQAGRTGPAHVTVDAYWMERPTRMFQLSFEGKVAGEFPVKRYRFDITLHAEPPIRRTVSLTPEPTPEDIRIGESNIFWYRAGPRGLVTKRVSPYPVYGGTNTVALEKLIEELSALLGL